MLLWLAACTGTVEPGPQRVGPDVLIVTWDTVRADRTSTYGYHRQTTPTLTALAARGLLFENFVVPQATTLPTHVSLFTGRSPDEHGVIGNSGNGKFAFEPPESLPPLATRLANVGYHTAGFVSSGPLKRFSGIDKGFSVFDEPDGRSRLASATTDRALAHLDSVAPDQSTLLWVHTYDPHKPYYFPADTAGKLSPFKENFDALGIRAPEQQVQGPVQASAIPFKGRLVRMHDAYDQEIRAIDDQLARLLAGWKERGRPDPILVVVGDHGEGLGQHDHIEHGLTWPEQLEAPFVVVAPGVAPSVVRNMSTAADLLPLLAAIGDFPGEADWVGASGVDPREHPDRGVLSRSSVRQLRSLKVGGGEMEQISWSWTTRDWFLHVDGATTQLFNRTTDPYALKDVSAGHPDVVKVLRSALDDTREQYRRQADALGSGRKNALSAETLEDLKALGYIDE